MAGAACEVSTVLRYYDGEVPYKWMTSEDNLIFYAKITIFADYKIFEHADIYQLRDSRRSDLR